MSEDEDEYEVLRRAKSEIYYVDKIRVFEKAFGIDQLHTMVKKLNHQRKVRLLLVAHNMVLELNIQPS